MWLCGHFMIHWSQYDKNVTNVHSYCLYTHHVHDYTICFSLHFQPCFDKLDQEMKCSAPELVSDSSEAVLVAIGLEMDNVQSLLVLDQNISVFVDPIFNGGLEFQVQPGQTRNITLTVLYTCTFVHTYTRI